MAINWSPTWPSHISAVPHVWHSHVTHTALEMCISDSMNDGVGGRPKNLWDLNCTKVKNSEHTVLVIALGITEITNKQSCYLCLHTVEGVLTKNTRITTCGSITQNSFRYLILQVYLIYLQMNQQPTSVS